MIHIYTEKLQQATSWVYYNGQKFIKVYLKQNKLLWCHCCEKLRRAKNCVIQSYYHGLYVWCAAGKGCKSDKVIAAKRRKEFRNRSAGQKKRFARLQMGN